MVSRFRGCLLNSEIDEPHRANYHFAAQSISEDRMQLDECSILKIGTTFSVRIREADFVLEPAKCVLDSFTLSRLFMVKYS